MVGRRVRDFMVDKGIKQTVIAKKIGVSDELMSQYLLEKVKLSADVFIKICDALEVSPSIFAEKSE